MYDTRRAWISYLQRDGDCLATCHTRKRIAKPWTRQLPLLEWLAHFHWAFRMERNILFVFCPTSDNSFTFEHGFSCHFTSNLDVHCFQLQIIAGNARRRPSEDGFSSHIIHERKIKHRMTMKGAFLCFFRRTPSPIRQK